MNDRPRTATLSRRLFALTLLAAALCACGRGDAERAAATPPPDSAAAATNAAGASSQPAPPARDPRAEVLPHVSEPEPTPEPVPDLRPARAAEVSAALARAYEGTVAHDLSANAPPLVGDFNGDGSSDLAALVRPDAARLAALNGELANWVVADPRRTLVPAQLGRPNAHVKVVVNVPTQDTQTRVEASDRLLVILHGHGPEGWRSPDARQTYLLKNAAGTQLRTRTRRDPHNRNLPELRGDIITLNAADGPAVIYWTGANYALAGTTTNNGPQSAGRQ